MIHARLIRTEGSQAVQIPAELAYGDWTLELEMERDGDELRIRPVRQRGTMADLLAALAPLVHDFKIPGRCGEPDLVDEVESDRAAP